MEAKSDIKKYVFLNEFFDRFNLIRAANVDVDVFDVDKYINEYVKVTINNKFIGQLGFTDVAERNYNAIKKMVKETRVQVPRKLKCPELRVFVTENIVQKLAAIVISKYDEVEKDAIKAKYPSTSAYKAVISYDFTDFDKERNALLTKFGNIVNIIIKKTMAELKHRAPKTVEDTMKEIDNIINEFKSTENDGDKRKQFNVNKDVFVKLQQTYKAIVNYKKADKEVEPSSIGSFITAVAKEVRAIKDNIPTIAVQHYVVEALPTIMEQALTTYVTVDPKFDGELPHITEMIKVTIEEHDKPPKPVKEKKPKTTANKDADDAEPVTEEEQPAAENDTAKPENVDAADDEPEEKPKKVIKRKAHKKWLWTIILTLLSCYNFVLTLQSVLLFFVVTITWKH